ncbi:hypothetical protein NVP1121O_117 [Vibrio phage 1.121.O._10N.286.46.C4]|nr:hypothetical protein NVP1121O_117 [Vibrio phage 1.121.O._10N.286.46.C4]
MNITMKSSKGVVTIDGKSFSGKNVVISGDKVVIDGVTQEGSLVGDVTVTVTGDVETLSTQSGNVNADKVGSVKTASGDVTCGDVSTSVSTMSGDVRCKSIFGSVKTMSGDIIQR